MIAFSSLGEFGRLGNQLFQYAFLRTAAQKLDVPFYCPKWLGDDIFDLHDQGLRQAKPCEKDFTLTTEDALHQGFSGQIPIEDWREYRGHFVSPLYFSGIDVRTWFAFRQCIQADCSAMACEARASVGIHLRFGDFQFLPDFYNPRLQYYKSVLSELQPNIPVLVFSDDHAAARKMLKPLGTQFVHIEGLSVEQDLYLMSQCRHFACSTSTLSWWGAYLRPPDTGQTFFPKQGMSRPGAPWKIKHAYPEVWTPLDAGLGITDHFWFRRRWLQILKKAAFWSGPIRHRWRRMRNKHV